MTAAVATAVRVMVFKIPILHIIYIFLGCYELGQQWPDIFLLQYR